MGVGVSAAACVGEAAGMVVLVGASVGAWVWVAVGGSGVCVGTSIVAVGTGVGVAGGGPAGLQLTTMKAAASSQAVAPESLRREQDITTPHHLFTTVSSLTIAHPNRLRQTSAEC